MGNLTQLQKLLLEKTLENTEISQFLQEDLKTDGVVEVLGMSHHRDYDKPDLLKITVEYKIRPNTNYAKTKSSETQKDIKNTLSEELIDIDISNEYNPEIHSNLSGIIHQVKSTKKPFLFTVNALETIINEGQGKKLPLPAQITHKCDTNGNHMGMGLFDFKGYWSIKPDGHLEMIIIPKQNIDMFDNDAKGFLQKQYEHETHIMHYQNGLDLPNLPIKKHSEALLRAKQSPLIIVKIDNKYVIEGESYTSVNAAQSEQAKIPQRENIHKEFPDLWKTNQLSYYEQLIKFELNKVRGINKQRLLTPPSEILKQFMGKEEYHNLTGGTTIKDFVMRYNLKGDSFDMALIPKVNLEILERDTESSRTFLEYFNNVFDTEIRVYGEMKVMSITAPKFVRETGSQIRFFANNDFYIRMLKLDQKITLE